MNKMSNKQKEFIFKTLLVLGCIFMLLTCIFGEYSNNCEPGTEKYKFYTTLGLIFLGLAGVICGAILYLMDKIKFKYNEITSKRLTLNSEEYEDFERDFLQELYSNNYSKYEEIPNQINCDIKYLINKNISINNIILILKTKDKELSDEAYKNYFEISLNYIIEKEPYLSKKNTNLIHIICVDKVNDNLRKITENNVEQGYGRFNLPVGISFGSGTVYIATQKGGFFIVRYKKLVKMFEKYIEKQIISTKV